MKESYTHRLFVKKRNWKNRLKKFAEEIESKNYKSDLWLKEQLKNCLTKEDEFNSPEGPFIPDLINRKYRYIVECDGSVHDLQEVKNKDFRKDKYFLEKGFLVLRVRFGNEKKIQEIREIISKRKFGRKTLTILRKKLA